MHERKIAHRDIKLDNLLYDASNDKLKIIDFGFSLEGEKGKKVN
jgi:serine/threonine protein kinase